MLFLRERKKRKERERVLFLLLLLFLDSQLCKTNALFKAKIFSHLSLSVLNLTLSLSSLSLSPYQYYKLYKFAEQSI